MGRINPLPKVPVSASPAFNQVLPNCSTLRTLERPRDFQVVPFLSDRHLISEGETFSYQIAEMLLGWMSSVTIRAQFINGHDRFPFLHPW